MPGSRMDPNETGNESSAPKNVLSSSPGTSSPCGRTGSESLDKLSQFVLPSIDGSPPKVLTLNEVTHVLKNIKNMELAHEIALNPEFKLQPYEQPLDSSCSLEHRIKEIMHKAFWDVLREQLQQTPPCYDHAIQLLTEIKECFPQILPPNQRALEHIRDVLDSTVIRQQAEGGIIDFKSYANFVIEIMAKSCAPARDKAVQRLTEIEDIVDMFKGILETMALMKLDMANFLLDFARNDIMANSVEYEKQKFKEYLAYYKFGFPATESWLRRSLTQDANNISCSADQAISNAYMDLMAWNEPNEFPEVLAIDKERILKLGYRAKRLCVEAAVISICCAIPIISQRADNRNSLAKEIDILMQCVMSNEELDGTMENIWEQTRKNINGFLEKEGHSMMDESVENLLKSQILQIAREDAPVRMLMWKRLQAFVRLTIRLKAGLPPPPPGYVDFKDELEAYAMAFKRVIAYNHAVFGEYFLQILTPQQLSPAINASTSETVGSTSNNPHSNFLEEQ